MTRPTLIQSQGVAKPGTRTLSAFCPVPPGQLQGDRSIGPEAAAATRRATDSAAQRSTGQPAGGAKAPGTALCGATAAAARVCPRECPPCRAGIGLRRRWFRGAGEELYLSAALVLLSKKYTVFFSLIYLFIIFSLTFGLHYSSASTTVVLLYISPECT